jgi:hypothetical protein
MVSIIGDGAAWIRNLTAAGSPRSHLHRGSLPPPRAPAQPHPVPGVHAGRARKDEWLAAPPGGPRLRLHRRDRRLPQPQPGPQPGSEPNPDARIADGSVTDTARRGDLL